MRRRRCGRLKGFGRVEQGARLRTQHVGGASDSQRRVHSDGQHASASGGVVVARATSASAKVIDGEHGRAMERRVEMGVRGKGMGKLVVIVMARVGPFDQSIHEPGSAADEGAGEDDGGADNGNRHQAAVRRAGEQTVAHAGAPACGAVGMQEAATAPAEIGGASCAGHVGASAGALDAGAALGTRLCVSARPQGEQQRVAMRGPSGDASVLGTARSRLFTLRARPRAAALACQRLVLRRCGAQQGPAGVRGAKARIGILGMGVPRAKIEHPSENAVLHHRRHVGIGRPRAASPEQAVQSRMRTREDLLLPKRPHAPPTVPMRTPAASRPLPVSKHLAAHLAHGLGHRRSPQRVSFQLLQ